MTPEPDFEANVGERGLYCIPDRLLIFGTPAGVLAAGGALADARSDVRRPLQRNAVGGGTNSSNPRHTRSIVGGRENV